MDAGGRRQDRRGTWQDWPARVLVVGAALMLFALMGGSGVRLLFSWLVIAFAGVSWAIRAGAFSPRRDS